MNDPTPAYAPMEPSNFGAFTDDETYDPWDEPDDATFDDVLTLVGAQAEDDGLWFVAQTAPEAYLQQELRRLHALIEAVR